MLDAYRTVFCDLDGCLIAGQRVLPGAPALLERLGTRAWLLSNNSTDSAATLSARLARLGLRMPAERIVLAGVAALDYLRTEAGARAVRVYGSQTLRASALERGLVLDAATPEYVLLTRDERFGYRDVHDIVRLVARGARLVAANLDATHPGTDGLAVPETGALAAMVGACLPDTPVLAIGKPEPTLFATALRACGGDASETVLIGDNPRTDGDGARRAGWHCRLIGDHAEACYRSLDELMGAEGSDGGPASS